jgi:hypothetical protein
MGDGTFRCGPHASLRCDAPVPVRGRPGETEACGRAIVRHSQKRHNAGKPVRCRQHQKAEETGLTVLQKGLHADAAAGEQTKADVQHLQPYYFTNNDKVSSPRPPLGEPCRRSLHHHRAHAHLSSSNRTAVYRL